VPVSTPCQVGNCSLKWLKSKFEPGGKPGSSASAGATADRETAKKTEQKMSFRQTPEKANESMLVIGVALLHIFFIDQSPSYFKIYTIIICLVVINFKATFYLIPSVMD